MSFSSLLIHTVNIFTATETSGTDRYGNPSEDAGAGTSSPARVEQAKAEELIPGRDTRLTLYLVFLPADVAVTSLSTIAWDGHTHRVVGEPEVINARSDAHHLELYMERIEG